MELNFNAENLSKPWFRALVGIIFLLAGIGCHVTQDAYAEVTRESCIEAEASIYEMRLDSLSNNMDRSIWLIFDDYEQSLTVHASCASDEVIAALRNLEKGEKVKFLHTEKNGYIYELWVNGELLFDFQTARRMIDENVAIGTMIGYILIPVGALFILSVPVIEFIKKVKK